MEYYSEPGGEVPAVSTRHWWQRWWGRVLAGIVILAVAFFGYVGWLIVSGSLVNDTIPSQGFTAGTITTETPTADPRLVRAHSPRLGADDAPLQVVEFSDFECPFCLEAFPIIRSLTARYPDTVQFVYRHFPVASIHDYAVAAAEASQCAAEQGKFWEYHDRLFLNQSALDTNSLTRYAGQAGLDVASFTACVTERRYAEAVSTDSRDGAALGVKGTPTWFINGQKVEGVIPRDVFEALIERVARQNENL